MHHYTVHSITTGVPVHAPLLWAPWPLSAPKVWAVELFLEGEESFLLEHGREEQEAVGALSLVCNRGEGSNEYAPALTSSFHAWEEPGYKANCVPIVPTSQHTFLYT